MEETNMRTVVIASLFCILLCLSPGLASTQFPTEKLEISAPNVATVGEEVTIMYSPKKFDFKYLQTTNGLRQANREEGTSCDTREEERATER